LREAKALALVIAVMVSASLLAGLYLPRLLFRGRIIIRAYAIGSDGDPTSAHQRLVLRVGLGSHS